MENEEDKLRVAEAACKLLDETWDAFVKESVRKLTDGKNTQADAAILLVLTRLSSVCDEMQTLADHYMKEGEMSQGERNIMVRCLVTIDRNIEAAGKACGSDDKLLMDWVTSKLNIKGN